MLKGMMPCPETSFQAHHFRKVHMEIEDLETASFKNNINLCLLQKVSVCYVENSTVRFYRYVPPHLHTTSKFLLPQLGYK